MPVAMATRKADLTFVLKASDDFPPFMEELENYVVAQSIDEKSYFDIKLCLEEILTNILNYGYPCEGNQPRISVFLDSGKQEVRVENRR